MQNTHWCPNAEHLGMLLLYPNENPRSLNRHESYALMYVKEAIYFTSLVLPCHSWATSLSFLNERPCQNHYQGMHDYYMIIHAG